MKLKICGAAVLFAATAHAPAFATVTFQTGWAATEAKVVVSGTTVTDPDLAVRTTPGDHSAQSQASSSYSAPPNEASATVTSSIAYSIASPNSGEIRFEQDSIVHTVLEISSPIAIDAYAQATGYFFYDFVVDTASHFSLSYAVTASGQTTAFVPLAQVAFLEPQYNLPSLFYTNELGDGAAGSVAVDLAPGAYRLTIMDFYLNAIEASGGLDGASSLSSHFSFTIDSPPAVPEPASWAMMIGGLGLVGGLARRRRASVSVAYSGSASSQ